jgi:hypothetical protein
MSSPPLYRLPRSVRVRGDKYARKHARKGHGFVWFDWGIIRNSWLGGFVAGRRDTRQLFDKVIDCLYEYNLGEALPEQWPPEVRKAIETSRKRIVRRRTTKI